MNREFAKGLAKVKENDFLAAIEHFTLAIEEDGTNVECFAERAVAYLNTNQYDLSMFDMQRCIEIEPNNSYRYSCRAFLKSKMGDIDGAIADYEIAVRLDPEDAIAYNNLGLAQESKGFRKKAEQNFQKSNELIGYNPRRFDESENALSPTLKNDVTEPLPNTANESVPTKKQILKGVFTSRSGFKDFWNFIRNGFRLNP